MKNFAIISVWVLSTALFAAACKSRPPDSKLAEVDGQIISSADLDKSSGKELFSQRQALYKLEQKKLDEYIGALLLTKEAKRRGVSVATLLDQEVNSKIAPVTDADIAAFYEANKERLRVDFEKIREQIREYLREQREEAQKTIFIGSLRKNSQNRHLSEAAVGFSNGDFYKRRTVQRRGSRTRHHRQVRRFPMSVLQSRATDVCRLAKALRGQA